MMLCIYAVSDYHVDMIGEDDGTITIKGKLMLRSMKGYYDRIMR